MKILKLFLLWWILSILSIGSFSNAESITTSCSSFRKACSVSDYTYQLYNDVYSCFNIWNKVEKVIITPNCSRSFNYNDWLVDYYDNHSCSDWPLTITNQSAICISSDNWSYTFDFVLKPLVSWWTSNFTPIITWLTNSINEFIPYVAYVWLGVLWVLIWFFAIKRLINWVRWNTLSIFNSRRKRK